MTLLREDEVLARHLAAAIGDDGPLGPDLQLTELLRHLPGRRAALLGNRDGHLVVVKVFASPRARGNHRRLLALDQAGLAAIAPQTLGVGADGHVGVLSYTPGRVLDTVTDEELLVGASGAGLALARVHRSGARLDRTWRWRDEVDQLVRRAPASLLPIAWGAQNRQMREDELVPSHRDFHPRQVVLATDATVRLIDFDDSAMAPAGLDVGNMVAHLRRESVVHGRSPCLVETAVRAFLAAYGTTPADLHQWVHVALIRLAGLAESRHSDPVQRDSLLTLAGPTLTATAPQATPLATGHDDRPVRVEERPGTASVIVKQYREGIGAEVHEAMEGLWASDFGAGRVPRPGLPQPLGWAPTRRELTMELLPGDPVAIRGSLGSSLDVADEAAHLLADLHSAPVRVERYRPLHRLVRSAARKANDLSEAPEAAGFAAVVAALELALGAQDAEGPLVLTHGDFSPRNVMVTPTGLALFDLDRVQLAAPARDVAYWGAWLWTTSVLAGATSDASWQLAEPFTEAYARHAAPGTAPGTAALRFHRALALMRIAHGWSALRAEHAAVLQVLAEARRQLDPD